MLPNISFAELLHSELKSDFEVLEHISRLSHELFAEADPATILLKLYGVVCAGKLEELKKLFFQAFQAEARHFDHQVLIIDHLWAIPTIDRAIKINWLVELLRDSRDIKIVRLLKQAVPEDGEAVANEVIEAIHRKAL